MFVLGNFVSIVEIERRTTTLSEFKLGGFQKRRNSFTVYIKFG